MPFGSETKHTERVYILNDITKLAFIGSIYVYYLVQGRILGTLFDKRMTQIQIQLINFGASVIIAWMIISILLDIELDITGIPFCAIIMAPSFILTCIYEFLRAILKSK